MTSYDLQGVRSQLPILNEWTYMNTGTVGIMPDPVFEQLTDIMRHYEQGGHTAQADAVAGAESAKEALAGLLNVASAEIALNRNATDGINLVAATFPLKPGDEVITSTEEHPAMILPLLAACERGGATLRFAEFTPDAEQLRANISQVLTDKTRLIAISHVSCETGTRLPAAALREIVGPEVAILIDASQSVGQFPVSIPELEADFVIGNGHKWLAGPKGSGFAWVSPSSEHLVPPAYVASDSFDPSWTRAYYQTDPAPALKFADGASRYEFGTRMWHLHAGLAASIEYQANLGWDAIFAQVADTSATVKHELAALPGVTVHTPASWEQSSGLVTFSIEGHTGVDLAGTLWNDYRIAQRRVESPSAVRVSCAYFTDDEDISKLAGAVRNIASGI